MLTTIIILSKLGDVSTARIVKSVLVKGNSRRTTSLNTRRSRESNVERMLLRSC